MKKQCEAINSFGSKAGQQCADLEHGADARGLCWAHRKALENPTRAEPVKFVAILPWQVAS